MEIAYPFIVLLIGVAIVLGSILLLRLNAFFSLICAAMVVSLMAPGEWSTKIERVASTFGSTAASVGIVIALAAVIGKAMMDSGAADRIVRAFLALLGEKRVNIALAGSGFTLSIPVFFDTAFYLLVPLARSACRRTGGRHYLKLLMAIVAGAALTHTLVPPTPGPLFIANRFGVDLGLMILMGIFVGLPAMVVGLFYAHWLDARAPVEMRPVDGDGPPDEPVPDSQEPSLMIAVAPILVPILLIAFNSIVKVLAQNSIPDAPLRDPELSAAILAAADNGVGIAQLFRWSSLIGNANLALLLSAMIAVTTLYIQRRPTRQQLANSIETALSSAGMIILITAAGGAFGGALRVAGLGEAIQSAFGDTATQGVFLLLFAFGIASLVKFAQGSSTTSMIVTSGMIAAMISFESLTFHPVYLALAVGSGSLVGSWMNDSGFWIYSKMGGLSEAETLKSWTPLLALLGISSGVMTLILTILLPMR